MLAVKATGRNDSDGCDAARYGLAYKLCVKIELSLTYRISTCLSVTFGRWQG